MRVKYNIDTKVYFLVGYPLDHSCTSYVNNRMFEIAGQNAVLLPAEVPKGHLPEFLDTCRLLNCGGFYLTTPHKEDIIEYLDEVDPLSAKLRSVNHVKIVDGRLIGIGLDGVGMSVCIEKNVGTLKGKNILILGAGAVVAPIAAELCRRGVKSIHISNRTVTKAEHVCQVVGELFPDVDLSFGGLDDLQLSKLAPEMDAVCQCTSSAHGNGTYPSLRFMDFLRRDCACIDVIYPTSPFLEKAAELGLKTANGIDMTINQQKDIIKFQFDYDLSDQDVLEAEEAFHVALAIRNVRESRLAGNKTGDEK